MNDITDRLMNIKKGPKFHELEYDRSDIVHSLAFWNKQLVQIYYKDESWLGDRCVLVRDPITHELLGSPPIYHLKQALIPNDPNLERIIFEQIEHIKTRIENMEHIVKRVDQNPTIACILDKTMMEQKSMQTF